jgi:hypothetical protein
MLDKFSNIGIIRAPFDSYILLAYSVYAHKLFMLRAGLFFGVGPIASPRPTDRPIFDQLRPSRHMYFSRSEISNGLSIIRYSVYTGIPHALRSKLGAWRAWWPLVGIFLCREARYPDAGGFKSVSIRFTGVSRGVFLGLLGLFTGLFLCFAYLSRGYLL